MGSTLTDLVLIVATLGCALCNVWVWPDRRGPARAVGVGALGCGLFTALALAVGDGIPGWDVLSGGFLAGFAATVRRGRLRAAVP